MVYLEKYVQPENNTIHNNNNISINVPTIFMVYQYNYKNDMKVSGFGDFIRGCFFILQFADRYNFNIDFCIDKHPIKKYLQYFSSKNNIHEDIAKNILFFNINNYKYIEINRRITYNYNDIDNELLSFIKNTNTYDKCKYIYLINHPYEHNILERHRQHIRDIIQPTYELHTTIETTLSNLNLTKHAYKIIHVRMNDDSFYGKPNKHTVNQLKFIINTINNINQRNNDDILLISSDNEIKKYIIQYIPNIKTMFHTIAHIAEETLNTDTNLVNTLKEFYIMSYANHIYSFSVYDHGSGFSKWCSVAYNIPYVCFRL